MIYTLVKNLFKILFTIFLRLKVEGKYSQGWFAGYSEQPSEFA